MVVGYIIAFILHKQHIPKGNDLHFMPNNLRNAQSREMDSHGCGTGVPRDCIVCRKTQSIHLPSAHHQTILSFTYYRPSKKQSLLVNQV